MKKVINTVFTVFSLLVIIFAAIMITIGLSSRVSKRLPRFFGYSFGVVPSESMQPTLMAGDYIIIKSWSFSDIVVGGIVVYFYEPDGIYIVHRVIERLESGDLIVQGDNNLGPDPDPVTQDNFHGVVVAAGHSFLSVIYLQYQRLLYGIVFGMFLLILISELVNIVKISKKKDQSAVQSVNLAQLEKEERAKMKEELLKEIIAESDQANENN